MQEFLEQQRLYGKQESIMGTGGGVPGEAAKKQSALDTLKEDEAMIVIGHEDKDSKRACILQVTTEKLFVTKKDGEHKPLLNYEFDIETQKVLKNGQPLNDANGILVFKRLLREFEERNKKINFYKVRRGEKQ
ncbi:hypothetical protein ACFL57_01875 [Candidatus Margulisiibacteriota bacterium]